MMMKARVYLAVGLILATMLGWARTSQAINLVPPILDYASQPGQTLTGRVKIVNDTAAAETYTVSTANFRAGGETGEPLFDFTSAPTDLATWIKTSVTKLELAPQQMAMVNLSITIPNNAEPGGHYAGVFFSTAPTTQGNVNIQQKTGALVILRVEGAVKEAAQVEKLDTVSGHHLLNRLPIEFRLRVRNTGNVHVTPRGTLTVRNVWGREVAKMDINPKDGAVLPNSVRRFDVAWIKNSVATPTGGNWLTNFFPEIGQEWRNFAGGPYTVTLAAEYGSGHQPLTAVLHLWAWPWHLTILGLIILGILVYLAIIGIRRYNAAIIRRAEKTKGPGRNPRP
jgi:hypothetical protein